MKFFMIMMIIVNLLFGSRFTKDNDIITDKITGIKWQDSPISKIANTLEGAIKRCKILRLGGFDDWRLPKKEEILSIVNYSNKNNPEVEIQLEKEESNNYDWTIEERSYMTHYAWFVYFKYGYSDYFYKYYSNFIRCVRGGYDEEKKKKLLESRKYYYKIRHQSR